MRVFLDANVLFSASQPASTYSRLMAVAAEHTTLLTSDVALAEALRNLLLKRPAWLPTFELLRVGIDVVPTSVFELPVHLDEKDVPLLCAAIHAQSDYFVTGDRKDFGHLFESRVNGVTVITPLRLAELLAIKVRNEGGG
jgi:predicted nucleic acid-binding protein